MQESWCCQVAVCPGKGVWHGRAISGDVEVAGVGIDWGSPHCLRSCSTLLLICTALLHFAHLLGARGRGGGYGWLQSLGRSSLLSSGLPLTLPVLTQTFGTSFLFAVLSAASAQTPEHSW